MALHHFDIEQHDGEPTPSFTLTDRADSRTAGRADGFAWKVELHVDDPPDAREPIAFTVTLDKPDSWADILIGGTWNLAADGPVALDSTATWWWQWHGHPCHTVTGTFRDVLDNLGFDLWRTDTPYDDERDDERATPTQRQ